MDSIIVQATVLGGARAADAAGLPVLRGLGAARLRVAHPGAGGGHRSPGSYQPDSAGQSSKLLVILTIDVTSRHVVDTYDNLFFSAELCQMWHQQWRLGSQCALICVAADEVCQ